MYTKEQIEEYREMITLLEEAAVKQARSANSVTGSTGGAGGGSGSGGSGDPGSGGSGDPGSGGGGAYTVNGATLSDTTTGVGHGLLFINYNSDGTRFFTTILEKKISQISLSTPYDVSTATWDFTTKSADLDNISVSFISGGRFTPDGTSVIACHQTSSPDNQQVTQYNLTSAFDLSTIGTDVAILDVIPDIPGSTAEVNAVVWNDDGTKLFVAEGANDLILEYALSSAYDISTASYTTSFNYTTATGAVNGGEFIFNSAGTKLLLTDTATNALYEIDLSTGFDLSTASYNGNSIDFTGIDTIPLGLEYNSDGSKLYVSGSQNDSIYTFDLVTI